MARPGPRRRPVPLPNDEDAEVIVEALCEGGEEQYAAHMTHPDVAARVAQALHRAAQLGVVLGALAIALAGCGAPSTAARDGDAMSDPIPVRVCGTVDQTPVRVSDEVCTALRVPLDWTPVIVSPDTDVPGEIVLPPGTAVRWWIANAACMDADDHTEVGESLAGVYINGDGDVDCNGARAIGLTAGEAR